MKKRKLGATFMRYIGASISVDKITDIFHYFKSPITDDTNSTSEKLRLSFTGRI